MNHNQSCTYSTSGAFQYAQQNPEPTAHITVNRNRLKMYGKNVYLKDKTCFEIELWNPKSTRVLAKISVNGVSVSDGGIIVSPGQRVYLERFVNEDRKFKFVTYEAENTKAGRKAIQNNGDVSVSFHDEIFYNAGTFYTNTIYPIYGNCTGGQLYGDPTVTIGVNNFFCSTNTGGTDMFAADVNVAGSFSESSKIETGRVEKGEKSDQSLVEAYGDFNFFASVTYSIKILPESQKPTEIGEIRSYCTGCGRRWRASENFCPTCGTAKNN